MLQLAVLRVHEERGTLKALETRIIVNGMQDEGPQTVQITRLDIVGQDLPFGGILPAE